MTYSPTRGAICKLATMSCNAENNCCAGNVNQNPYVCQQDILGIPRCTLGGDACATSADCCGLPCVPNPSWVVGSTTVPPFVCGGICVGVGGACTTTADCCPGLPYIAPPGSTRGTCGGGPPPSGDGGTNPPPGDGGGNPPPPPPPGDGGPPCADYGQVCSVSSDCCSGIPCNRGRCVIIVN
jgi:hypothetical protein